MFKNYSLFVQEIHDIDKDEIIMYELLLRKFEKGRWGFPEVIFQQEFMETKYSFFVEWFQNEVEKALKNLNFAPVSININSTQFFYIETLQMLERLRKYSDNITIEITEDLMLIPEHKHHLTLKEIDAYLYGKISSLKSMGYKILLDDVSCGINSLERATYYTPVVDGFKFSVRNLKLSTAKLFVEAWQNFAVQSKKQFILENIEDFSMSEEFQSIGLNLQQGYFLDKPANLHECVS
ncbi:MULTISPECIES: EAL domain-containing protein [Listeria]|uniref:EAL domain-containing protein n=1 Tax=Listeria TaxID=1637 RepID=UPI000B59339B|nr:MULTISPECIES: EAL domain-containing protein [Listeria]